MKFLEDLITFDIYSREMLLKQINEDLNFQRKIPTEVKVVIYKLYDFLQEESYDMLKDLGALDEDIFNEYLEHNSLFEDVVFNIEKIYELI